MEVVGICIRNPQTQYQRLYNYARNIMNRKVISVFDQSRRAINHYPLPININRLSRLHKFRIIFPSERGINDPEFIKMLRSVLKPSIALSYIYYEKFSPELLGVFHQAVNYHNGLLPKYRGLRATEWSIYNGEEETGFSFHLMNENIDEGPELLKGAIPVRPDAGLYDVEYEKTVEAVRFIPKLLDLLSKNVSGVPQSGESNYFSKKDWFQIRTIDDPSNYTSSELFKRVKAFGHLFMNINGNWCMITRIEIVSSESKGVPKLCFRASDGIIIKPTRFQYLPFSLFRVKNWIRRHLFLRNQVSGTVD